MFRRGKRRIGMKRFERLHMMRLARAIRLEVVIASRTRRAALSRPTKWSVRPGCPDYSTRLSLREVLR